MTVKLHHDRSGAGDPVLILHGLLGSARNWRSMARSMAGDYDVLTVDLRNHGASPHTDSMRYEDMATDVAALIADEVSQPVTLVGHSMGGKVAMTLALHQPALVQRLVVVDIAPIAYPDRFGHLVAALRALPLATLARRAQADALLADSVPDATLRSFLLHNLVDDGAGGWRWQCNLETIASSLPEIVGAPGADPAARYDGPCLVIRGGRSDSVPPEAFETIGH
ncbi:MAG: alpha/beta fold hydrolase, partial [Gammaproteobacteria bacterium]|nr:alpha/beta fold hydrolase [Gammaproteobacteria bacterium]